MFVCCMYAVMGRGTSVKCLYVSMSALIGWVQVLNVCMLYVCSDGTGDKC